MNSNDIRFFKVAKTISKFSNYEGPHLGVVVVENKRIISTGFNCSKTNPLQKKYNIYRYHENNSETLPKVHAEVKALAPLIGKDVNWKNVSLYIYRELKNGMPACSKPCCSCEHLIKDLGIRNIYYIDSFGNFCREKII